VDLLVFGPARLETCLAKEIKGQLEKCERLG